jgi:anaphase-promoting complex subunit 4
METLAFTSLGLLQLPSPSRLLSSACCPDKDLVVIISRLGGHDRMSLWNYSHGSRVWEIDFSSIADGPVTEIVALAWSPDGMMDNRFSCKVLSP